MIITEMKMKLLKKNLFNRLLKLFLYKIYLNKLNPIEKSRTFLKIKVELRVFF